MKKTNSSLKVKIIVLIILAVVSCIAYMTININFYNPKLLKYSLSIRSVKLIAIIISSFTIGAASLIFQTIINNRIVTPCLLGMNALYTLIRTCVFFFLGAASIFASNNKVSFVTNLIIMLLTSFIIYGYIFKKSKYNILYILLIGSILTSFFSSIQSTLIRVMDPNEYDALLSRLIASFNNVNSEIILISLILISIVLFVLRKELANLNVIAIGKNQSINLGLDYDKSIKKLLIGVTALIAIATAMVGPISFLGLIIANLARSSLKTYKHSYLITAASLLAIIFLIAGQCAVEHIFNYEIPVSILIIIAGGIYFLYLLLFKKRSI